MNHFEYVDGGWEAAFGDVAVRVSVNRIGMFVAKAHIVCRRDKLQWNECLAVGSTLQECARSLEARIHKMREADIIDTGTARYNEGPWAEPQVERNEQ
jgi:hypothetical protein